MLGLYNHPISIAFLDDNMDYLDSLTLGLDLPDKILKYHSPNELTEVIEESKKRFLDMWKVIKSVDGDEFAEHEVNIRFTSVHRLIYEPTRFNTIPIIIVDYDMPEQNGLAFCKRLHNQRVFKIMLTAKADENTAVHAFNEGLIDKFILKNQDKLHEVLSASIQYFKSKYFANITNPMLAALNATTNGLLNTYEYKTLLEKLLKKYKACEYYIIDSFGSCLMFDMQGNTHWLIVRSNEDFHEKSILLTNLDAPEYMIDAVKNKKKLLFLFDNAEYKKSVAQWEERLYDAMPLNEDYSYSSFSGEGTASINWQKVCYYR